MDCSLQIRLRERAGLVFHSHQLVDSIARRRRVLVDQARRCARYEVWIPIRKRRISNDVSVHEIHSYIGDEVKEVDYTVLAQKNCKY